MKDSVQIIIISLPAIFVKHQFINKINADNASSGTARRTVDHPSNPYPLQHLVDAANIPAFAGKLSD